MIHRSRGCRPVGPSAPACIDSRLVLSSRPVLLRPPLSSWGKVPRAAASFDDGKPPGKGKLIDRLVEWLEKPQASGMKVSGGGGRGGRALCACLSVGAAPQSRCRMHRGRLETPPGRGRWTGTPDQSFRVHGTGHGSELANYGGRVDRTRPLEGEAHCVGLPPTLVSIAPRSANASLLEHLLCVGRPGRASARLTGDVALLLEPLKAALAIRYRGRLSSKELKGDDPCVQR